MDIPLDEETGIGPDPTLSYRGKNLLGIDLRMAMFKVEFVGRRINRQADAGLQAVLTACREVKEPGSWRWRVGKLPLQGTFVQKLFLLFYFCAVSKSYGQSSRPTLDKLILVLILIVL